MSPREKRSARDVALDALMQVDKANAWSDEALRRLIAQNGLDSRDAAFATRLCYGVMQNRMLLDYYIGCWCAQKPERLEPVIRSILRIGGYQILFMDRVPHRAAVNEAVEMTRRRGRPKAAGMVNAVLRRFVEHWMDMPDLPKGSTADYLSLRYSHPKWLVLRLLDLVGPDETQAFLRLDNDTVPTCIQVNPLRTTAEELERELRGAGVAVQPHPWLEGCLEITGTGDLRSMPPSGRDGSWSRMRPPVWPPWRRQRPRGTGYWTCVPHRGGNPSLWPWTWATGGRSCPATFTPTR